MKRILSFVMALVLISGSAFAIESVPDSAISLQVESAVLLEKTTGEIIYEKNSHKRLPPASVTKVMTMLLVVEAIADGKLDLDDTVTGSAHARSMGGSQIWLEDGETMSVDEMLKCVAVVSANDCAVALAEHVAGSEEAFVALMNARAAELGCTDTHFTNCTGLFDDDAHYTSAWDLGIMSRELISHDMIKNYTTIWIDTIRDGSFGLSNTNKLIRYYAGATGLKTGYTSKAGHCLAATAEKNGVEYIAVVLKGQSGDARFEAAKTLLNYAFANYALVSLRPDYALAPIAVELGTADVVQPVCTGPENVLIEKNKAASVSYSLELPEAIHAPVQCGDVLGTLIVRTSDETLAEIPVVAADTVDRMGLFQVFKSLFELMVGKE